jgi:acetylornithine aminotransferase
MRINPVLSAMRTYPYLRLDEAKAEVKKRGVELLDFGVGEPHEPTDIHIRQTLIDSIQETYGYPAAIGLPALRDAVARWYERRFGVTVDGATEVVPTYGSKEAIFTMSLVVGDAKGDKNLVLVPEPAYPVYERGALFAGMEVQHLPLLERNGFLPDYQAISPETWRRTAILWVNYPNNPTAAVAPPSFYEDLSRLAIEYDFLLASDEAYGEIYFGKAPLTALAARDRRNVAVINTLSKRSSMVGYRSGAIVASPELVAALRAFRPNVGVAPQEFVQRAAIWAWDDEQHVADMRHSYAAKREALLDALEAKHLRVAGCEATFYLWVATPNGQASEDFAVRLLDGGIVVTPGSYFGGAGEGYVRFALVPTLEQCQRAAKILKELL